MKLTGGHTEREVAALVAASDQMALKIKGI
jgi:hypothetical protein